MIFFERANLIRVVKDILSVFTVSLTVTLFVAMYILGLSQGYKIGYRESRGDFISYLNKDSEEESLVLPNLSPSVAPSKSITYYEAEWGGPELWSEVNKRRQELGVGLLNQRDELCTIASIRLNELLELGKLDGHVGFSNMTERRPDLQWIFDRYSSVAEFLAVGGESAEETVSLWENTLGHKKLLTGGEYVWGCIYAQNSFSVAITAF
jgi:hypothetical protein